MGFPFISKYCLGISNPIRDPIPPERMIDIFIHYKLKASVTLKNVLSIYKFHQSFIHYNSQRIQNIFIQVNKYNKQS